MRSVFALFAVGIAALFLAACSQDSAPQRSDHPGSRAATAAPSPPSGIRGTVTETMNAGGYTYVHVDTGSESVWGAAPEFVVQVGDQVIVPDEMPMYNYHSSTLDRTFELVYFASAIPGASGTGTAGELPPGHPPIAGHGHAAPSPDDLDLTGIERADDGKTVAELFAEKAELAGEQVVLRGKVVKFNSQIMGKNWVHVRDGSGDIADGTHDVTITTDATAKVGDTVLVRGTVVVDKDFGFGYRYDLMIEDAEVTVE